MTPLVIALIIVVVFNLIIFPIAFSLQTDKLTDVTYSLSFIALAIYGFISGDGVNSYTKTILFVLILLWGLRLGIFLFFRVSKMGKDDRFDDIRVSKLRFFRFFLLQGVSSWVIALPFLYYLLSRDVISGLDSLWFLLGTVMALLGLLLETVADYQKFSFKESPGNRGKLYTGGLYSIVRYPNYTGEILFWIGIFVYSIPALSGISWMAVLSPIIIIVLLLYVSGIPFLEKGRKEKYGDDPDYWSYKSSTKRIIPGIY